MRRLAVVSSTLFALLFPGGAQAWTWPIDGPVLRPFVFGSDPYAAGQHRGIDVGGAVGESVRAPMAGTVSFAGSVPAGGRALTIRTGDGYSVTLLQLGSIAVQRGDEVGEGARVGAVGESSDAVDARAARAPGRAAHRRRGGLPRPARVPARAPPGRGSRARPRRVAASGAAAACAARAACRAARACLPPAAAPQPAGTGRPRCADLERGARGRRGRAGRRRTAGLEVVSRAAAGSRFGRARRAARSRAGARPRRPAGGRGVCAVRSRARRSGSAA